MKLKHFLSRLEHNRIHQAIQAAEQGTASRIVVYLTRHAVQDPLAAALKTFRKLHLETPQEQANLLLFIAPRAKKFALAGGTALHQKLGQPWWDHLAALLTRHFQNDQYTEGLLAALGEVGLALQTHFPSDASRQPDDSDIVED
jgi:uncharacterized membrane protein